MEVLEVLYQASKNRGILHMGDVIGLTDVCRNKIIGLSLIAIFYRQAYDTDLKLILKAGVEKTIPSQINKIQKLLAKKGFDVPSEQNWKRKYDETSPFVIPRSVIDDQEIGMSVREASRLTLTLEAEAIRNATDKDVRNVIGGIMEDDNNGYDLWIKFQKLKGWTDFPPNILIH